MQDFHFYVSNCFEWRTGTDLAKLMTWAQKYGKASRMTKNPDYWAFYIPLNEKEPYDINYYQPVVEGATYLGTYDSKGRIGNKVTDELSTTTIRPTNPCDFL